MYEIEFYFRFSNRFRFGATAKHKVVSLALGKSPRACTHTHTHTNTHTRQWRVDPPSITFIYLLKKGKHKIVSLLFSLPATRHYKTQIL
jgi:hypothetical protein